MVGRVITTTDYSDYEDSLLGQRIKITLITRIIFGDNGLRLITQIALITRIIFWDNGLRMRITQIT